MNGRKSKAIRKKSIEFVVEWLKTMLIEEEQKKVSVKNYKNYMPTETHIFANNKFMLSAYSLRWFYKQVKRNPNIQLKDLL